MSSELIGRFIDYQRLRGLSPATDRRRRWSLTTFASQIEPRTLADATTDDVERFMSARQAPATRRRRLLAGISAEDHERSQAEYLIELPAIVARLRAENDELEAEIARRRRLRLVEPHASSEPSDG